jgi:hypothetical protein
MAARPKQQHYVTRAYLAEFLQPEQDHLVCYGRPGHHIFKRKPEDLAKQRDYYSFKRPDGSWDDAIEHLLDTKIESPGIEIIKKLVGGNTRLNWNDRIRLSMLIATQRMRVPYFRQMVDSNYKEFIRQLSEQYDQKERELGYSPGPMRLRSLGPFDEKPNESESGSLVTKESLLRNAQLLETNPGRFSLESILDLAESSAKIFQHMKWTVHHAPPGAYYLTSDAPVIVRFTEREDLPWAGLVRPDCEIRFPLARSCALSMAHDMVMVKRLKQLGNTARAQRVFWRTPEIRLLQATTAQVSEFNQNQVDFALRWVFSGVELDWLPQKMQGESKNIKHILRRESENRLVFESLK